MALGRFIQADTLVPSPANPQSLNRYSYVLNSPLRYTDPSGHYSVEQIMKMFHTSSWEDVLSEFGANGNFAGKWGWLEILLRAEDGDTLWAGNQSGEGATFTRLIEGEFMFDEPNGSLSLYRGWGLHGAQYTAAFEIVHGCDFFLLFPNGPSSLNFNDEIRIPGTPREIFATSAYQHHPHTIFDMHRVDWNGIAIDGGGAIVGFIPTPLTQLLGYTADAAGVVTSWEGLCNAIATGQGIPSASIDVLLSLGGLSPNPYMGAAADALSIAKNIAENTRVYTIP